MFQVNRERLLSKLSVCNKILSRSIPVNFPRGVFFLKQDKDLFIFCTDMEIFIEQVIKNVKFTDNEVKIFLPFDKLYKFLLYSNTEEVVFSKSTKENDLSVVVQTNSQVLFSAYLPENFPFFEKVKKLSLLGRVQASSLYKQLKVVASVVDESIEQKVLAGINFSRNRFVATDTTRIVSYLTELNIRDVITFPVSVVDILFCFDEPVELFLGDNHNLVLHFLNTDTWVYARLIEGTYPDIEKILSNFIKFDFDIFLDRGLFLETLKRAEIFVGEYSVVELHFSEQNTLMIKVVGLDVFVEYLTFYIDKQKFTPFVLYLNLEKLKSFLQIVDTQKIILRYKNEVSPIFLAFPDNQDLVFLMMPMKVR